MSTCHHGFNPTFCEMCRNESEANDRAKVKAGTHGYIISAYHPNNDYSVGNAVSGKVYKSRAVAESICDKGNAKSGFERVVRLVKIQTTELKG